MTLTILTNIILSIIVTSTPLLLAATGELVAERAAEAAGRAHDHHALDAEIEHAGPFGDELAGCRDQERCRGGEHRQDDGFNQLHGSPVGSGRLA